MMMPNINIKALLAIFPLLISQTEAVISGTAITNRCRAPYNSMVALQFSATFSPITFCSAVMITDTILVTTAQCLFTIAENSKNNFATAVIGEKDIIMKHEPEEQRIDIKSFKIHFFNNRTTRAYNIGLIELAKPAKLGRCVKPAIRMEKDTKACSDVDDSCQMVGWGSYAETKTPMNSRLPRAAAVTVYSDLITLLLASPSPEATPIGSLYAETIDPSKKACFFDWGGVVSCRRNGYNVLKGIISNHNCNSQRTFPILILDIEFYQDWIDRCTKNWNACPALKSTNA